jgi:hypothetical protein
MFIQGESDATKCLENFGFRGFLEFRVRANLILRDIQLFHLNNHFELPKIFDDNSLIHGMN